MPAAAQSRKPGSGSADPPSLVGWHGVTFLVPPDWNVTGFSPDRADGYLKVDSPGTMFVQVKWFENAAGRRAVTVGDALIGLVRRHRESSGDRKGVDLRATLDGFLKQVAKQHRKAKTGFEFKIKPETVEAGGERTAHHFSWTAGGQGQGQGKIWRCSHCGRTVIVQVVGQTRDNLAPVASQLFGSFRCHGCDGWEVWALYDLVAAVPDDFRLKGQILMSGRLRLEFERGRGERLQIERWGLANVTRKRFTLAEWLREAVGAGRNRVAPAETTVQDHPAASVSGRIAGALPWVRALRDAGLPPRPASRYAACCWECAETNKIYAIQLWHSARTVGLLEEVAQRCECH